MPKYIDAEKIELKYEFGMVSDEGIVCVPIRDVKKSIDATPTDDVVEVVRCKDCKHKTDYCGRTMCSKNAHRIADGMAGLRATDPDGFCSDGKRRDT